MKNQRGIAIIMVLLISVILFVIAVAFSTIVEREYRIAGESEKMDKAEYLADAGLQMTLAAVENAVGSGSSFFFPPENIPSSSNFWNSFRNMPMNIDGYNGVVTVELDYTKRDIYRNMPVNPNDPRVPPRNSTVRFTIGLSDGSSAGIDYVCFQERRMKQVTYTYIYTYTIMVEGIIGYDDDGNPIYGDVPQTSTSTSSTPPSQYPAYMPGIQYLYEIYVKATAKLTNSDGALVASKTLYATIAVNTCPLYKDTGGNDRTRTRYTTLRIWNERK